MALIVCAQVSGLRPAAAQQFKADLAGDTVFGNPVLLDNRSQLFDVNRPDIFQCLSGVCYSRLGRVFPAFGGIGHYLDDFYNRHNDRRLVTEKHPELPGCESWKRRQ